MVRRSPPIDGGYAWVVTAAVFGTQILCVGYFRAFGVFFVEVIDTFHTSSSLTSLIMGVQSAVCCLTALVVHSVLLELVTARTCVLVGGFLMATGMMLGVFAHNIAFLIFCLSVLVGLGNGMTYGPSIVLLGDYFLRRRALANSLASMGASVGSMVLPVLATRLVLQYGLRGALLLYGAVTLHVCAFASLYRPLDRAHRAVHDHHADDDKDEHDDWDGRGDGACHDGDGGCHDDVRHDGDLVCHDGGDTEEDEESNDLTEHGALLEKECLGSGGEILLRKDRHVSNGHILLEKKCRDSGGENVPGTERYIPGSDILLQKERRVSNSDRSIEKGGAIKALHSEDRSIPVIKEPVVVSLNPLKTKESETFIQENQRHNNKDFVPLSESCTKSEETQQDSSHPNKIQTSHEEGNLRQATLGCLHEKFTPAHSANADKLVEANSYIPRWNEPLKPNGRLLQADPHTFSSAGNIHFSDKAVDGHKQQSLSVADLRPRHYHHHHHHHQHPALSSTDVKTSLLSLRVENFALRVSQPHLPTGSSVVSEVYLRRNTTISSISDSSSSRHRQSLSEGGQKGGGLSVAGRGHPGGLLSKLRDRVTCDTALLGRPAFWLVQAYVCVGVMGATGAGSYLPALMQEKGLSKTDTSLTLTLWGALNLVGRLLSGVIADRRLLQPATISALAFLGIGVLFWAVGLLPHTLTALSVFSAVFGLLEGVYFSMLPDVIVHFVTRPHFSRTFGFVQLSQSGFAAMLYPVLGGLKDTTCTYHATFYCLGTCALAASFLLVLIPVMRNIKKCSSRN